MRWTLLVACIALVPGTSLSQPLTLWAWESPSGETHYTDSRAKVPRNAKRVHALQVLPRVEPTSPEAPARAVREVSRAQEALEETQWRDRFVAAQRKIASLELRLRNAQALLNFEGPCPDFACVAERERRLLFAGQLQADLVDARADAEQLEPSATRLGIPREWRRGW
jgi:hypothetical protein